ncbi:hypothetical protein QQF51_12930 [Brucella intermedia]|uniref:hypothetical protein n=1 Tax=Brucella intermedia TaxID=94625 RepID=UPI0025532FCE|nr:hypothetical protein [Brucella intermedia]MDL2203563.1 hypothetical protein [Brucella intermedia]
MPSKELIEKVARDICDDIGAEYDEHPSYWNNFAEIAAGTILAALQEPTEGMVKLGEDAFDAQLLLRVTENKKGYPSEATHELPSRVAWRAMLAASPLSEER